MTAIIPGQKIGRWTVLEEYQKTSRGETKRLCLCECGTSRYVLERALKSGGSLSCGCLRKEAAAKAVAYDLIGQTFGELTVIRRSNGDHENGGIWWECRCSCGNYCEAPATLLVKGRKTNCGCQNREKNYYYKDITGQRFGRLVAQYRTEKRSDKGGVIWHCQCDCGNEADVPYNTLMYTNQQSCGCQKKEHNQKLGKMQARIDGTSVDIIRSRKVPSDNTSGYRGVYLIRGKYVAKIVLQKKAYYLGTFDNIEDAHEARLEAEEAIFQPTVEYHARWKARADADPLWAEENPMQIFVRNKNGRLSVEFIPAL